MKAVKNNWLAFAIMAALAGGCGDTAASNDGDNTGGGNGATAGTNNTGGTGGNTGGSGGGNTGSNASANTGGTSGTNTGGLTGGDVGDGGGPGGGATAATNLPAASECGYQTSGPTDTSAMGGCFYFYCYQTEATLRAAATTGGCANDTDVAVQCEGQSVRTVSECARMKSGTLLSGTKAFTDAVTECARADSKLNQDFSDACLECNVQSSLCAAQHCLAECVSGDSKGCDDCREKNKCTPDFYTCAGLPNPKM